MRRFAHAALFATVLSFSAAPIAAGQDYAAGKAAYDAGDFDTAVAELRPLAMNGSADAQFLMAMIHSNGFGVRKDRGHAAYWYRLAAEQGHDVAQLHLGFFYLRGYGVPQDRVFSLMWTALSAERGNVKAREWRTNVANEMTPDEIAEALARAADWLKRHNKLN